MDGKHTAAVHALRAGEAHRRVRPGHDLRTAMERDLLDGLAPWRSRHPDVPVDVSGVSGTAGRTLSVAQPPGTARWVLHSQDRRELW